MGVKAWITVNGNHIPIMDGEGKMEAVGRFIKSKQKTRKDRYWETYDKSYADAKKRGLKEDSAREQAEFDAKIEYDRETRPTIKGREKTPQERREDAHKYISGKAIEYNRQGMSPKKAVKKATLEYAQKDDTIKTQSKQSNYFRGEYMSPKSYKLKEDKPAKTSRSKTIRDTNLRVGDTFKNHAGRVASQEAKIIKYKDGKYGLQISGVDGKPYRNTKYASIYQLEDDLKKQGYRYKKDW